MRQNLNILQDRRIHPKHVQILATFSKRSGQRCPPIGKDKRWDRWRLLYGLYGDGVISWPGSTKHVIKSGDAFLLASNTEYVFNGWPRDFGWRFYSVSFLPRAHWYEWLKWPELAPGIMRIRVENVDTDQSICQRLNHTAELAAGPHVRWEEFAMAAMELVLLTFDEINPLSQKQHGEPRLKKAIEFMEMHLAEKLTREQIAQAAMVSPSHLGVLFHKYTGMAPLQYLDRLRIDRAQRLLRQTTETISRIGYMVGYDRVSYFGRRFRAIAGLAPGDYRKALK